MPNTSHGGRRDAIIIGGGHNGLVTAFYLAQAGMRPLVLERREVVGGACVTEEFAPGYFASTGAHVLGWLRPYIWKDMRLAERGVHVSPGGPSLSLYSDGRHFLADSDLASRVEATRQFSERDALRLPDFEEHMWTLASAVMPLYDRSAPDPRLRNLSDARELGNLTRRLLRHRKQLQELAYMFTAPVTRYLDEWFESDHLKATLGWTPIIDSTSGPSTPGTAFQLLRHYAAGGEDADEETRGWGFVRGGMGTVTQAMAAAANDAGAEIRTGAEVSQILLRNGRAIGVALESGEELLADRVISNADPKRTYLTLLDPERDLPPRFADGIRSYRSDSTSFRIFLGLSRLPEARGVPHTADLPYHAGIIDVVPFLRDQDRQQSQAAFGIPGDQPHIEVCFPTVHDPSLAPEGKHVMDIVVASQPYQGPDWDAVKESRADLVVARLAEYFPDLPDAIEVREALSPVDQERRFGMTGAHNAHGEMAPDQFLFMRPMRGYGDHRTPIDSLYMCGAGTHPGGGVSGAPGRIAARRVLRDAKSRKGRTRA